VGENIAPLFQAPHSRRHAKPPNGQRLVLGGFFEGHKVRNGMRRGLQGHLELGMAWQGQGKKR